MQSAGARLTGAAVVLATYYWVLFVIPAAAIDPAELQLRHDIEASLRLYSANRYADALEPTRRVVEQLPSQAIYRERLARVFENLKRPDDEVREWEAFMATSPTPVDACPMVAEAHLRANREDLAVAAFEKCAALPPVNPDFLLALGQLLVRMDRGAEARQAFERGLAVDDAYSDLHLLLGVRQLTDGDIRQARESFARFLALAPARRDEVAVWLTRTGVEK